MATIALNAGKIGAMPGLIANLYKSVSGYRSELAALASQARGIDGRVCDLSKTLETVSASVRTLDEKMASLDEFGRAVEAFAGEAARIDAEVADLINRRKDEFYSEHYNLKPDSEKNGWERIKDGFDSACRWCRENWKSIAKILLTVVIIAAIGILSVMTGGALAVILAGAFWGALFGALSGGIMGGVLAALTGGSFLEGFADGALTGAVTGAVTGALGAAGGLFGSTLRCGTALAKAVSAVSKVTLVLSTAMDGFDLLAMGAGLLAPGNPLSALNSQLHSSKIYNAFQAGVNALAVFTGAAAKNTACFVAGTAVLTAAGMVNIEALKAGDFVTATDPETFETSEKRVIETYVRSVTRLVRIAAGGSEILTTADHPFFVRGAGFVNAALLAAGDLLCASDGTDLPVAGVAVEDAGGNVTVHNMQVEDSHTYRVGPYGVMVHNAEYSSGKRANEIGAARENKVAELTEGKVSREKVKTPSGGTDIDVVTKSGDLVAVGGPAKAKDLGKLANNCKIYKEVAESRGVKALGYFTSDTPDSVIKIAKKWFGDGNVHLFDLD